MTVFNNLVWVCGYIGFISDSFTVFMNLHNKQVNYKIARDRMRVTNPGMILNWAWYYPRWKNEQVDDPNLYKQITLDESLNFAQASFVMREQQLLDKFPGSRTITLMAENTASIEYYLAYAHFKLLDKTLYGSWYNVQKKNFPLNNPENQEFADKQFELGMTPLQYRSIAFQDWQGEIASKCEDPVAEWNEYPYHDSFMENRKTIMIEHEKFKPSIESSVVYMDRLVNPQTSHLNKKYYIELCNTYDLEPNLKLFEDFWGYWLSHQTDISDVKPQLSWKHRGKKVL